jgi:elongation factor 1-gamma
MISTTAAVWRAQVNRNGGPHVAHIQRCPDIHLIVAYMSGSEFNPTNSGKFMTSSKLDLLPPSTFDLEEWKKVYINCETKPVAMDEFWKHFDAAGWSIWRVDYKYNDELTKLMMSSRLARAFLSRLHGAKRYVFGSLIVFGQDNSYAIAGYFVIRGHEVPDEVTSVVDYGSYTFARVDEKDEKIKAKIGDYFAWEGPLLDGDFFAGYVLK